MIRPRFALGTLLLFLTLTAPLKAVNKEKLRRAVSLPHVSVIVGFGVSGRGDFVTNPPLAPILQPDKIAAIEKELKGDATDVERYSRLAQLYYRAWQFDKGKEARRKIVPLIRKQFEQHPDDSVLRRRLADALSDINEWEESESLLRRSVKECPNDWHAWLALGEVLDHKSRQAILKGKPFTSASPEAALQSLRAAHPTTECIAAARRYRREAVGCFNRAVALAPDEAEVYRRRGASCYHYGDFDFALRSYQGEKADFYAYFFGREAMPDLRRAVNLSSDDYTGLGMVAMMETWGELYQSYSRNPSAKPPEKMWDALSESSRQRLRADLARLEQGLRYTNKLKAAEAAETLGALQFLLLQDAAAAEKSARQSTELDPTREAAWDTLLCCAAQTEDARKMVAILRQRLQCRDCARTRLLLAKGYETLDQLDKAEKVVRAGLEREPNDYLLNLALADLLLMRGEEEELDQVARIIDKLEHDYHSGRSHKEYWVNYSFTCAIGSALAGDVEQARERLKEVRKREPKYPHLRKVLKALDE